MKVQNLLAKVPPNGKLKHPNERYQTKYKVSPKAKVKHTTTRNKLYKTNYNVARADVKQMKSSKRLMAKQNHNPVAIALKLSTNIHLVALMGTQQTLERKRTKIRPNYVASVKNKRSNRRKSPHRT
uniref:60S ribosomal protein L28 n=1 Tax=Cacopsylla melanoneura TaxID=428564 RepID=A0A8D8U039_9HEMI